jgi:antitoxin CptB
MTDGSKNSVPRDPRLRWQCRRSCLEIDLLLNTFLDDNNGYALLDAASQASFADLLAQADSDLLDWLLGRTACPHPVWQMLIARIRASQSALPLCK